VVFPGSLAPEPTDHPCVDLSQVDAEPETACDGSTDIASPRDDTKPAASPDE